MTAALGAVLGFDVGHKRIGVAVGNPITGTASEVGVLDVRDGMPDWAGFDRLLKAWAPTTLVVGDPLALDDDAPDSPARQRARRRRTGPVIPCPPRGFAVVLKGWATIPRPSANPPVRRERLPP